MTVTKDWTIMVYFAGDNNLSGDMAFSLNDIQSANGDFGNAERDKVNVLAYFDGYSLDAPTLYIDYSEQIPERHVVTRKDLHHGLVKDTENSASSNSIINFVRWCIRSQKRKARNYALIFSGHSFGFFGTSLMRDQSSGRYLSLRRFRWALEESKRLYFDDKRIGIIGFDSCDMSMLEVGYELKDVAQTIVASEGSVPNSGWSYAPLLRNFVGGSDRFLKFHPQDSLEIATPPYIKKAARSFVGAYIEHQRNFAIGGRSVDMSAWDLDEIGALTDAVDGLGRMLADNLGLSFLIKGKKPGRNAAALHYQTRSLILQSRIDSQAYMQEQTVDLKDFCQRLRFECLQLSKQLNGKGTNSAAIRRMGKQCEIVIRAVDQCVMATGFSGDEYQFSKGISIFFPWTALTYLTTLSVYSKLRFNAGIWKEIESTKEKGRNARRSGFEQIEFGGGRNWGYFLYFYLLFVTLRRCEDSSDFEKAYSVLESGDLPEGGWLRVHDNWKSGAHPIAAMSRDNWPVNRDNWPVNRDNWPVNRDNWPVNRDNWPVNRDNWPVNRDNWPVNRDNWPVNRDNWPVNRDNWPVNRDNWPVNRGTGGLAEYLRIFGRIRNFQLRWDAYGLRPRSDGRLHDENIPEVSGPPEKR